MEFITTTLMGYYQQYLSLTQSNPIAGSAVFVTVTGILYGLFKDTLLQLPGNIWSFILRWFTTTTEYKHEVDACTYTSDDAHKFYQWYLQSSLSYFCKNMRTYNSWIGSRHISEQQPGPGVYPFLYKGSFGLIYRYETTESMKVFTTLSIRLFGSNAKLVELLDMTRQRYDTQLAETGVIVNAASRDGWGRAGTIRFRTPDTLTYADGIIEELLATITQFQQREEWYVRMGIPYKLVIALEGPPGTGKTSLIRALATHYKKSLSLVNIHDVTDSSFTALIAAAGTESFVIVEDFDSSSATRSRVTVPSNGADEPTSGVGTIKPTDDPTTLWGLTLTGLLNGLDGLMTPHGLIVFLTTNHIGKIDPAVIRPGRCDKVIHVGKLKDKEIRRYIGRAFPELELPTEVTYSPLTGAEIQQLVMEHLTEPTELIDRLPVKKDPLSEVPRYYLGG